MSLLRRARKTVIFPYNIHIDGVRVTGGRIGRRYVDDYVGWLEVKDTVQVLILYQVSLNLCIRFYK